MSPRKNYCRSLVVFGLVAGVLVGCSSSKTTDGLTAVDEPAPVTDAGTDAVPAASAEADLPPADLGTPPADPSAPAAPELAGADPLPAPPADLAPPVSDPTAPASMASQTANELNQLSQNLDSAAPAQTQTVAPVAVVPQDSPRSGSASAETESYTVQDGDTLMRIAFEVYGDLYKWRGIYEMNRDKIPDMNAVPAGTVLQVEKPAEPVRISRNGKKYLIKHGDTLGTISEDVYGTPQKWKKLWHNNRELIKDPNRIFAGFHVYYRMSAEDKRELEEIRKGGSPEVQQQPMATTPAAPVTPENTAGAPAPASPREPASAGMGVGTSPVAPAAQ